MGFFRNVGKMSGAIYNVGKKAVQFKRRVGNATGGASDKLLSNAGNAIENQLRDNLPQYDHERVYQLLIASRILPDLLYEIL